MRGGYNPLSYPPPPHTHTGRAARFKRDRDIIDRTVVIVEECESRKLITQNFDLQYSARTVRKKHHQIIPIVFFLSKHVLEQTFMSNDQLYNNIFTIILSLFTGVVCQRSCFRTWREKGISISTLRCV